MRTFVLRGVGRLHLVLLLWVVAVLPVSHQLAEAERLASRFSTGSSNAGVAGSQVAASLEDADAAEASDRHGPTCAICRVLDTPRFGAGGVEVLRSARAVAPAAGTLGLHAPQGAREGGNARDPPQKV